MDTMGWGGGGGGCECTRSASVVEPKGLVYVDIGRMRWREGRDGGV